MVVPIVPVVVNVPPVIGAVVATLVTDPLPPLPLVCSHPAVATDVQAGAAVPETALQTYSLWFVVSVNKSPGRFPVTDPGAAVPRNFCGTLVVSRLIVPVAVIGPPRIGEVVATLETVPPPLPTAVPFMYSPAALIVPAPLSPPVTV